MIPISPWLLTIPLHGGGGRGIVCSKRAWATRNNHPAKHYENAREQETLGGWKGCVSLRLHRGDYMLTIQCYSGLLPSNASVKNSQSQTWMALV